MPFLLNNLCGDTEITTYRSPCGPPFIPGSPCPFMEITESLSTPAGISTAIVTVFLTVPEPLQVLHGFSITSPLPPQYRMAVHW